MQKEECDEWMSIDEDIPVAATLTDLEICQAVCEQDQAIKINDSDGDECVEENPPTNAKMRQALDIGKWVVQHRSTIKKNTKKTGQEITSKIVTLSQKSRVCIQWIPSHVGVFGNEVADLLAKEGSDLPSAASGELFASEIFSIHRVKANSTWKVPPEHEWYAGNRHGLSLHPKVQDPHRLHWPDFVVTISKA
ncbi:hypothetical protein AVEN_57325-1 [Araneus ventricosus]|uniref:RNase H type-1 domain-containing protein n=1 Tax=Araneus ventricosus TaxID=182803 RepID=A0A4Y2IRC0_ARAVE|nr:hypothetical protein AVEN_57325-1 [Araneus ventricosus]